MDVQIQQSGDRFYIDIPPQVLPLSKLKWIEERIEVPGHEETLYEWYPVIVRAYHDPDRTALLLTHSLGMSEPEAMTRLGFDPEKPIYIRPYGLDIWIRAHLYHGDYVRVWIPKKVAIKTGIRNHTSYPVWIRGITLPKIETQLVKRRVRDVTIEHNNRIFTPVEIGPDIWRWPIQPEQVCYPVLQQAFNMKIQPIAQLTRSGENIICDIVFNHPSRLAGYVLAESMGYAFRTMAVRNYVADDTDLDYPFLCEIRATYLTNCPIQYYHSGTHITPIKQALETTVYNMLEYFFPHDIDKNTGQEYQYSRMSYTEHIGKIDWTNQMLRLKDTYPKVPVKNLDAEAYINYVSEGEVAGDEVGFMPQNKKLYYCIKYIRILNESSYEPQFDIDRWEYLNDRIESMIAGFQRARADKGLPTQCAIDSNGFIWKL